MTKMDAVIIRFIIEYYRKKLFYPNYDEIAEGINRTKSTVHTHMRRMENEGVIIRKDDCSPQYRLINMDFVLGKSETKKCRMVRLTEKEVSGRWQVNGISWEKIREGETITKEIDQLLYGCICKLKDYEDIGMNPDQLEKWWYELEDMAGHVCDNLCRYPRELTVQEELDEICERCPVSVFGKKLLGLTEG